jgi:hypothetical protein
MADCKFLEKCPFFNNQLANMPGSSKMIKKKYCLSYHNECARYTVAIVKGRESVPENLWPGDRKRAEKILVKIE